MCDELPSIKPKVCKVTSAEAGVIWQVMIWALDQAGNRAGKTRHHWEVMRLGAQTPGHGSRRATPLMHLVKVYDLELAGGGLLSGGVGRRRCRRCRQIRRRRLASGDVGRRWHRHSSM